MDDKDEVIQLAKELCEELNDKWFGTTISESEFDWNPIVTKCGQILSLIKHLDEPRLLGDLTTLSTRTYNELAHSHVMLESLKELVKKGHVTKEEFFNTLIGE